MFTAVLSGRANVKLLSGILFIVFCGIIYNYNFYNPTLREKILHNIYNPISNHINSDQLNAILGRRRSLYHPIYGSCSVRAGNSGWNQKVVALSIAGNFTTNGVGLEEMVDDIMTYYPGWNIWVYSEPHLYEDHFVKMMIKCPRFYVCDIVNMPHPLKNIKNIDPTVWTISPMGDPQVDVFLARKVNNKVGSQIAN